MEEEIFKQKQTKGEVEEVKEEKEEKKPIWGMEIPSTESTLEDFLPFLEMLRQLKKPITSIPTNTPSNFLEQIEFWASGSEATLCFYIVGPTSTQGAWRFIKLT